jgi:hypothetical protein
VLELDDGVIRPELLANLLPRHHLAWAFQEHGEDQEGLLAQPDSLSAF